MSELNKCQICFESYDRVKHIPLQLNECTSIKAITLLHINFVEYNIAGDVPKTNFNIEKHHKVTNKFRL